MSFCYNTSNLPTHVKKHYFENSSHCMFVSVDHAIYCFKCEGYVRIESLDEYSQVIYRKLVEIYDNPSNCLTHRSESPDVRRTSQLLLSPSRPTRPLCFQPQIAKPGGDQGSDEQNGSLRHPQLLSRVLRPHKGILPATSGRNSAVRGRIIVGATMNPDDKKALSRTGEEKCGTLLRRCKSAAGNLWEHSMRRRESVAIGTEGVLRLDVAVGRTIGGDETICEKSTKKKPQSQVRSGGNKTIVKGAVATPEKKPSAGVETVTAIGTKGEPVEEEKKVAAKPKNKEVKKETRKRGSQPPPAKKSPAKKQTPMLPVQKMSNTDSQQKSPEKALQSGKKRDVCLSPPQEEEKEPKQAVSLIQVNNESPKKRNSNCSAVTPSKGSVPITPTTMERTAVATPRTNHRPSESGSRIDATNTTPRAAGPKEEESSAAGKSLAKEEEKSLTTPGNARTAKKEGKTPVAVSSFGSSNGRKSRSKTVKKTVAIETVALNIIGAPSNPGQQNQNPPAVVSVDVLPVNSKGEVDRSLNVTMTTAAGFPEEAKAIVPRQDFGITTDPPPPEKLVLSNIEVDKKDNIELRGSAPNLSPHCGDKANEFSALIPALIPQEEIPLQHKKAIDPLYLSSASSSPHNKDLLRAPSEATMRTVLNTANTSAVMEAVRSGRQTAEGARTDQLSAPQNNGIISKEKDNGTEGSMSGDNKPKSGQSSTKSKRGPKKGLMKFLTTPAEGKKEEKGVATPVPGHEEANSKNNEEKKEETKGPEPLAKVEAEKQSHSAEDKRKEVLDNTQPMLESSPDSRDEGKVAPAAESKDALSATEGKTPGPEQARDEIKGKEAGAVSKPAVEKSKDEPEKSNASQKPAETQGQDLAKISSLPVEDVASEKKAETGSKEKRDEANNDPKTKAGTEESNNLAAKSPAEGVGHDDPTAEKNPALSPKQKQDNSAADIGLPMLHAEDKKPSITGGASVKEGQKPEANNTEDNKSTPEPLGAAETLVIHAKSDEKKTESEQNINNPKEKKLPEPLTGLETMGPALLGEKEKLAAATESGVGTVENKEPESRVEGESSLPEGATSPEQKEAAKVESDQPKTGAEENKEKIAGKPAEQAKMDVPGSQVIEPREGETKEVHALLLGKEGCEKTVGGVGQMRGETTAIETTEGKSQVKNEETAHGKATEHDPCQNQNQKESSELSKPQDETCIRQELEKAETQMVGNVEVPTSKHVQQETKPDRGSGDKHSGTESQQTENENAVGVEDNKESKAANPEDSIVAGVKETPANGPAEVPEGHNAAGTEGKKESDPCLENPLKLEGSADSPQNPSFNADKHSPSSAKLGKPADSEGKEDAAPAAGNHSQIPNASPEIGTAFQPISNTDPNNAKRPETQGEGFKNNDPSVADESSKKGEEGDKVHSVATVSLGCEEPVEELSTKKRIKEESKTPTGETANAGPPDHTANGEADASGVLSAIPPTYPGEGTAGRVSEAKESDNKDESVPIPKGDTQNASSEGEKHASANSEPKPEEKSTIPRQDSMLTQTEEFKGSLASSCVDLDVVKSSPKDCDTTSVEHIAPLIPDDEVICERRKTLLATEQKTSSEAAYNGSEATKKGLPEKDAEELKGSLASDQDVAKSPPELIPRAEIGDCDTNVEHISPLIPDDVVICEREKILINGQPIVNTEADHNSAEETKTEKEAGKTEDSVAPGEKGKEGEEKTLQAANGNDTKQNCIANTAVGDPKSPQAKGEEGEARPVQTDDVGGNHANSAAVAMPGPTTSTSPQVQEEKEAIREAPNENKEEGTPAASVANSGENPNKTSQLHPEQQEAKIEALNKNKEGEIPFDVANPTTGDPNNSQIKCEGETKANDTENEKGEVPVDVANPTMRDPSNSSIKRGEEAKKDSIPSAEPGRTAEGNPADPNTAEIGKGEDEKIESPFSSGEEAGQTKEGAAGNSEEKPSSSEDPDRSPLTADPKSQASDAVMTKRNSGDSVPVAIDPETNLPVSDSTTKQDSPSPTGSSEALKREIAARTYLKSMTASLCGSNPPPALTNMLGRSNSALGKPDLPSSIDNNNNMSISSIEQKSSQKDFWPGKSIDYMLGDVQESGRKIRSRSPGAQIREQACRTLENMRIDPSASKIAHALTVGAFSEETPRFSPRSQNIKKTNMSRRSESGGDIESQIAETSLDFSKKLSPLRAKTLVVGVGECGVLPDKADTRSKFGSGSRGPLGEACEGTSPIGLRYFVS